MFSALAPVFKRTGISVGTARRASASVDMLGSAPAMEPEIKMASGRLETAADLATSTGERTPAEEANSGVTFIKIARSSA